jgi:hypothetical protein
MISKKQKPPASLSLDLDNKWAYLKTHGDASWAKFPGYFDVVVPRFLEFLRERSIKATVFVVGQDAVLDRNKEPLAWIADAGHEIGNHSFHHEPWLHLYTPEELSEDFARSEEAIYEATGQQTKGFRGPGFSLSDQVLETLIQRGYQYDASTFPTFLGPVARAYYFMTSKLSKAQKQERKALFGSVRDGFQSNKPYFWTSGTGRLLEIPVTTMPVFKVPIHASYLLYLGKYSRRLAITYYWQALLLCRLTGVRPSLLLHPLDFLGEEDDAELSFFPAMDQPAERKIELLSEILRMLMKDYEVVTMHEHARIISQSSHARPSRLVSTATPGVQQAGKLAGANCPVDSLGP